MNYPAMPFCFTHFSLPFIASVYCPSASSAWSITAYPSHNFHFHKPSSLQKAQNPTFFRSGASSAQQRHDAHLKTIPPFPVTPPQSPINTKAKVQGKTSNSTLVYLRRAFLSIGSRGTKASKQSRSGMKLPCFAHNDEGLRWQ